MPRICVQATTTSAAIAERDDDWISGGISWIASLIATLLKPQLRQSPTVTAIGEGVERAGRRGGSATTSVRTMLTRQDCYAPGLFGYKEAGKGCAQLGDGAGR